MAAKKTEQVTGEGEFTCDCGRTFTHGAWYTKHKVKCDGQPVATSGRIAARSGEPSRAVAVRTGRPRKAFVDEKTERRREQYRTAKGNGGVPAIAAAATDKAIEIVIAGLMAKRAQIDAAIDALQVLGG